MDNYSSLFESVPSESTLKVKRGDRSRVLQFLAYLRQNEVIDDKSQTDLGEQVKSSKKFSELVAVLDGLPPQSPEIVAEFVGQAKQNPFSNRKLWLTVDIVTILAAVYLLAAVSKASSSAHQFAIFLVVVAIALIVIRNIIFRRS